MFSITTDLFSAPFSINSLSTSINRPSSISISTFLHSTSNSFGFSYWYLSLRPFSQFRNFPSFSIPISTLASIYTSILISNTRSNSYSFSYDSKSPITFSCSFLFSFFSIYISGLAPDSISIFVVARSISTILCYNQLIDFCSRPWFDFMCIGSTDFHWADNNCLRDLSS
jgi:hypothetical protein